MVKDSKRDSTGKEKAGSLKEKDSPKERDKGKRKDEQAQQHAAYGPEFLRAFAKTASHSKRKDADPTAPFAVISGAEAHRFARRFVRCAFVCIPPGCTLFIRFILFGREQAETEADAKSEAAAAKSDAGVAKSGGTARSDTGKEKERLEKPKANARTLPPVVFALPRTAAGDAGRKVVDFYMSWRGKTVSFLLNFWTARTCSTSFLHFVPLILLFTLNYPSTHLPTADLNCGPGPGLVSTTSPAFAPILFPASDPRCRSPYRGSYRGSSSDVLAFFSPTS